VSSFAIENELVGINVADRTPAVVYTFPRHNLVVFAQKVSTGA